MVHRKVCPTVRAVLSSVTWSLWESFGTYWDHIPRTFDVAVHHLLPYLCPLRISASCGSFSTGFLPRGIFPHWNSAWGSLSPRISASGGYLPPGFLPWVSLPPRVFTPRILFPKYIFKGKASVQTIYRAHQWCKTGDTAELADTDSETRPNYKR